MTKFKVCSRIHLFIIISSILIIIGMAVGTICHFVANGFFNFGGEFSSYKCVTVTYYSSEYKSVEDIKPECDKALGGFNPYEISSADTNMGGELVYKFAVGTDSEKLEAAVEGLNTALDVNGSGLNVASFHQGEVKEGGSRALIFAAIALASAAAFQFIYFIFRYKLRSACSALLACVHNLGLFVALAAITRVPVGISFIAMGAAVILITMISCCVLLDRTKKNFANEKYARSERLDVVDTSAAEVRNMTVCGYVAIAIAVVVLGVFAAISAMYAGVLAPYALAILGLLSCAYGSLFFTPAVHGAIDGLCEKVKIGTSKPAKKSDDEKEKA